MCDKHGLDYRLLCEECKEKCKKFQAVITQNMIESRKKYKSK